MKIPKNHFSGFFIPHNIIRFCPMFKVNMTQHIFYTVLNFHSTFLTSCFYWWCVGILFDIFNTVKFCDFYGFDYENLRTLTDIPLLKIESDFTPMPQGQLATRLEAFE